GATPQQLIATLQSGATLVATDIAVDNGGTSGQVINGTSGNDSLVGTAADETINGFAGNDFIDGAGGRNVLNGGDGNDTIDASHDFQDIVDGGAGVDTEIMQSGLAGAGIE